MTFSDILTHFDLFFLFLYLCPFPSLTTAPSTSVFPFSSWDHYFLAIPLSIAQHPNIPLIIALFDFCGFCSYSKLHTHIWRFGGRNHRRQRTSDFFLSCYPGFYYFTHYEFFQFLQFICKFHDSVFFFADE